MAELPRALKHATVWLLLGTGVFLGVQAWQRHQQQSRVTLDGAVIELRRGADGHVQAVLRSGGVPLEVSRRCVPHLKQTLLHL